MLSKCRSSRPIQSRRIKLSLAQACPSESVLSSRSRARMLLESSRRRVDVCGKALLGPENSRLMREAEEKERKTKVSEVAKRVERRKKSNGALARPRIRDKQQRGEGKQCALGKENAAATRLE